MTLRAAFGPSGVTSVRFQGVELTQQPTLAVNQTERGGLSTGQWIGLAFTGVIAIVIGVEAADDGDDPEGTGAY